MSDINKAHRDLATLIGVPDEVLHSVIAEKAMERVKELEYDFSKQEHIHAEYRGQQEGKTCGYCNWLERAACVMQKDKLEESIAELVEERDSARNSVLEMVQPAIAPRLCKQWGMKMPKPVRIK